MRHGALTVKSVYTDIVIAYHLTPFRQILAPVLEKASELLGSGANVAKVDCKIGRAHV